ncbi:PAS domain S-box protein [Methylocaldum sp.]|uniref:PAS domain S-box protein n=1 Tax=Methylocaldum sp. TaxID=1969727 RepID=UPI002D5DA2DA|nr:PAS domain S-box protein [Methylocaldum sp.]HYE35113.1 PAS domain S-box protein [Methylocaldum sp.]
MEKDNQITAKGSVAGDSFVDHIGVLHSDSFLNGASRWPSQNDAAGILPASSFRHRRVDSVLARAAVRNDGKPKQRASLLVAESNANMRSYFKRFLEDRYEVLFATNGTAALDAVLSDPPDLVLADLKTLLCDGSVLLRALKDKAKIHHIPVILTSARSEEKTCIEELSAGVDDYLIKPISARGLLACVATHIELAKVRREAAQALSESEAKYKMLLDSLDDGVFVAQDCRFVFANPALSALLGYTDEECIGLSFQAVVAPEDLELWGERFMPNAATRLESPYRCEAALLRRDGRRVSVEICARRIHFNRHVAILGIVRDMTDRKRLEAAQVRLIRMIEASQDLVGLAEPDGKLIYVNGAGQRMLGFADQDGLVSTAIGDHLSPRMKQRILDEGIPAALREGAWTGETALLARNGSEIPVSQMILAHRRADGSVEYLSTVCRDISERMQAEDALRESEERFRRVVEQAPIPIFVHALDGQILEISCAVTELTGWTHEDVPDARAWFLKGRRIPEEEVDSILAETQRRFTEGSIAGPEEITVWTKDGDPRRWLFYGSAPMRLPDRRPFLASMAIDVTDRRKAEQALREADRLKDEFVAMLAHELRNPLAPIRNAVQVLRQQGLTDSELKWTRDVIGRQVAQMSHLLDDLLDISRITRGTIVLKKATVELATVVERAVETSLPLIKSRRHKLTVGLPQEPVQVEGDVTRLVQVVANLLNNAAKYTDAGGCIDLTVEIVPNEVLVRVRDNGMGIPGELLPHIFELFTQGSRSLDRSQGGLGLGLALVRRLIEMHGGRVEAQSAGSGRGAEFIVHLPRIAAAPSHEASGSAGNGSASKPAGVRVLVVDDNVDSAESMALLLSLDGHDVRTAFDGPGALTVAAEFQPEAVLLDIGLPGMDGYEVARQMRGLPGLQKALMIAVTGYGQADDRARSKAAGFDHHLVKPVDPEILSALLATLRAS